MASGEARFLGMTGLTGFGAEHQGIALNPVTCGFETTGDAAIYGTRSHSPHLWTGEAELDALAPLIMVAKSGRAKPRA